MSTPIGRYLRNSAMEISFIAKFQNMTYYLVSFGDMFLPWVEVQNWFTCYNKVKLSRKAARRMKKAYGKDKASLYRCYKCGRFHVHTVDEPMDIMGYWFKMGRVS